MELMSFFALDLLLWFIPSFVLNWSFVLQALFQLMALFIMDFL